MMGHYSNLLLEREVPREQNTFFPFYFPSTKIVTRLRVDYTLLVRLNWTLISDMSYVYTVWCLFFSLLNDAKKKILSETEQPVMG